MRLNEVQKKFKDTMFQTVDGVEQDASGYSDIFEAGDIDLKDRLKVYHNNVIGSISASVVATFPLLENLVGEDFLKSMARQFIFENPPFSGCLHVYGVGFDDFIRTYEPAKDHPYLPDVAALELAINHAYYAKDDIALGAECLGQIAEDQLADQKIALRESVTLLKSGYPLLAVRDFCLNDGAGDSPDFTGKNNTYLMVFRPEFEVVFVTLNEDEFNFLSGLNENKQLGDVLESVLATYPDFNTIEFLQKHLSLGTFKDL